ncbi:hypothetical protein [Pseudarthrobacter sp. N5]|uniref:hypothetical protein n=1 Tax=Pseudarthrobacter sp. N5 TaxID=3418416 RepID=UPI003CEF86CE
MNQALNRLLKTAAAAVLIAGILTGCANPQADLQPGAAEKLQERLQSLARSAADQDFPAARTALDLLASDVSTAAANGDIPAGRRQDIQNAIDLIRADLTAMTPAPKTTPTPPLQTPSPAVPPPTDNGKGKGKDVSHSNDD